MAATREPACAGRWSLTRARASAAEPYVRASAGTSRRRLAVGSAPDQSSRREELALSLRPNEEVHVRTKRWSILSAAVVLVLGGAVACDDDPAQPVIEALDPTILVADTIGQQEALRVVFPRAVDPVTALDPANFIVTNLCSGLRVPGALRLVG